VQNQQGAEAYQTGAGASAPRGEKGILLRKLYSMPGREAVNRIFDLDKNYVKQEIRQEYSKYSWSEFKKKLM